MVLQLHQTAFVTIPVILAVNVGKSDGATDCMLIQFDCTGQPNEAGIIIIVVIVLLIKLIFIAVWWFLRRRRRMQQPTQHMSVAQPGPSSLQTVTSTVPFGYPSSSTQGISHPISMDQQKPSYDPVDMPDSIKLVG